MHLENGYCLKLSHMIRHLATVHYEPNYVSILATVQVFVNDRKTPKRWPKNERDLFR